MVASNWKKLRLLIWKNWRIQNAHRIQLVVEFVIPIVCMLILVILRSIVQVEDYEGDLLFDPVSIDSIDSLRKMRNDVDYRLLYSPSPSPAVEELLHKVSDSLGIGGILPLQSVNHDVNTYGEYFACVVFPDNLINSTILPNHLNYSLRFPGELRTIRRNPLLFNWQTDASVPELNEPGPRVPKEADGGLPPGYIREGFIALQHAIAREFVRLKRSNGPAFPTVQMQRFPFPPYRYDFLLAGLEEFLAISIVLSFIYPCINTVKMIALEKERQLKEAMKIMGLPGWMHWAGWFVRSIVFLSIIITIMVIILKVHWAPSTKASVLTYSSWTLVWFFLFTFSIAAIGFFFMMSTFFSIANQAAAVAGLIWFVFYLVYLFVRNSNLEFYQIVLFGLFHNTAMSMGCYHILRYESTGEGAQWNNLGRPFSMDSQLSLGVIMAMLLVDAVVYLLIALYVEQIHPGAYGVPKPWNFLFTKVFWVGTDNYEMLNFEQLRSSDYPNSENFEDIRKIKKTGIQIRQLRKQYSPSMVAVDSLSLDVFENEITVLLGHNGAGKTTTMAMLTGMTTPTSGTALVNGFNIRTHISDVRGSVGLCPQHNILFDELTVREHIIFYSRVKGMDSMRDIETEVNRYLRLIDLENKADSPSKTLSGGMKRKLSVCIAFCGGSRVVFCDEPTAGMDPAARRALWDIFASEKKGRTILLSTHFMDEADVLGDRIAIVNGGKLISCGTPFFMKKRFGVGYHLVCSKSLEARTEVIAGRLRAFLTDVIIGKDSACEVTFHLDDMKTDVFPQLFEDLDNHMTELGVLSYGVSVTTLEDVFMNVGSDNIDPVAYTDPITSLHSQPSAPVIHFVTGLKFYYYQTYALLVKRFRQTRRSWFVFLAQLIIPTLFIVITVLNERSSRKVPNLPPLRIGIEMFGQVVATICHGNGQPVVNDSFTKNYEDIVIYSPGSHSIDYADDNMQSYLMRLTETNQVLVNRYYMVGCEILSDRIIAWFNNQPYHSAPVALSLVHNALVRSMLGHEFSIQVTNQPWEYSSESKAEQVTLLGKLGLMLGLNITYAMSIVSAFFVLSVVKEQANQAKFLQFVSGANVYIYWATFLLWDYLVFIVSSCIMIGVLGAFGENGWSSLTELSRIFATIVVFGFAALPFTYLLSRCFSIPTAGLTVLTVLYILSGLVLSLIVKGLNDFEFYDTADLLAQVFMVLPHFALNRILVNLQIVTQNKDICQIHCNTTDICTEETKCQLMEMCCEIDLYSLDKRGILMPMLYMIVVGVLCCVTCLMLDTKTFLSWWYKVRERLLASPVPESGLLTDSDVLNECQLVASMTLNDMQEYSLVTKDLSKMYRSFCSVNQLSFTVEAGECFGLLGVNGAGKTSTFRMLTGDLKITDGDAFVQGISLRKRVNEVHRIIGYCPQFEALIEELTCRQCLELFCYLRGIPKQHIHDTIERLAAELNYTKHLDKEIRQCSGGNRRKLSTSVAILGNPVILFLDEPTTGMDPGARRNLWNMIIDRRRTMGTSVVLSSHSMDECEALCTKLAIMVNGEFKCLGSVQHLKSKFSKGIWLVFRLRLDLDSVWANDKMNAAKLFVRTHFPMANLISEFNGLLTYHILGNDEPLRWSKLFGLMNKAKNDLDIEDYTLSQTSLEQVFLSFAQHQKDLTQRRFEELISYDVNEDGLQVTKNDDFLIV